MQEQKNEQQPTEVTERKPNRHERRTAESITRKAKRKLVKTGSPPLGKQDCGHNGCRTVEK